VHRLLSFGSESKNKAGQTDVNCIDPDVLRVSANVKVSLVQEDPRGRGKQMPGSVDVIIPIRCRKPDGECQRQRLASVLRSVRGKRDENRG
jgi:hypothetical protein